MQNNTMNFKNQSAFFISIEWCGYRDDDPSDAENMIQILREQGNEVHWVRVEDETGYVQALESPKRLNSIKMVLPRFNGATALLSYAATNPKCRSFLSLQMISIFKNRQKCFGWRC
jgi:hypothetical protein